MKDLTEIIQDSIRQTLDNQIRSYLVIKDIELTSFSMEEKKVGVKLLVDIRKIANNEYEYTTNEGVKTFDNVFLESMGKSALGDFVSRVVMRTMCLLSMNRIEIALVVVNMQDIQLYAKTLHT